MIEHNLDVIKTADHIIDLGPEGIGGGIAIIATEQKVAANQASYTGQYLKERITSWINIVQAFLDKMQEKTRWNHYQ